VHINKNDHAGRDACCQAKNIYQGKRFVLKQVSPCDLEVVIDHGQQLG
jgi:hypothetical protein